MALTACQKGEDLVSGGETSRTITVTIPQVGQTRATAADFGSGSKIDRCILQVYRNNQPYGDQQVADVKRGQATFDLRLVAAQTYDFVFWADCSTGDHYNTADLSNITVKGAYAGNNDEFDAFTGSLLDYNMTEAFKEEITLNRPFGQLNVKTADIAYIPDAALKPTQVKVAFSAVPTSFNAHTGLVGSETAPVEYTADVLSENGDLTVDYIWAPAEESTLADFAITFLNGATEIATNGDLNNIPIRRNYRTNVTGNLLTKKGQFIVTIDPGFDGTYSTWDGETYEEVIPVTETIDGTETQVYKVESSAQFAWMLANSAYKSHYIQLCSDVDLADYECPQVASFSGTLDGQNHIIKGLKITTGENRGLFNTLSNGTVKNLIFESGVVHTSAQAGLIANQLSGKTLIENCINKGVSVSGDSNSAGGFVAKAYGSQNTIKNCKNYGAVHSNVKCGGIVGIASASSGSNKTIITGCENHGEVSGAASAGNGGILGYAGKFVEISDCHNYGNVGGGSSERLSGGIVGYTQVKDPDSLKITNSVNEGRIQGNTAGGILGGSGNSNDKMYIANCVNKGEVVGGELAGGIAAGAAIGKVLNCDNEAVIRALNDNGRAGGVVGHLYQATVSDCHGGTAAIEATYSGRQLGSFSCGPNIMAYLALPTDGADSYDNDMRSIGGVSPYTALANITITAGELKGLPKSGGNNGTITINEGASWDAFPNETGTWGNNSNGTWMKK